MNTTELDKEAYFKELWNLYRPGLVDMCKFRLNSVSAEIDDVLDEVYMALWNTIDSGVEIRKPKEWLYSTTHNYITHTYKNTNKTKKNLVSFNKEGFEEYALAVYPDFADELISDEKIEELAEKITEQLDESEQLLYKYIYEDKLKHKEVASLLSTTLPAVKQKNYRLTRKIKKLAKKFLENL